MSAFDAGTDSTIDSDIGSATDAGPPPLAPRALFPWNGLSTGSIHATTEAGHTHPLKPTLKWTAIESVSRYEIQMTRECDHSSFRECAFIDTEVDSSTSEPEFTPSEALPVLRFMPVGSRYYWRVRACSDLAVEHCSSWSEPRYLNVGRQDSDFNGDGYADVAVGGSGVDSPAVDGGQVFVFLGSATGPSRFPAVRIRNPQNQRRGGFGSSIASTGDLNGDGYSDLIVGASHQDAPEFEEGTAYVYFGGPSGPATTPSVTMENPLNQRYGRFGSSVAGVGDVDGDGFFDIVVGAEAQDSPETDEGSAYLFLGSPLGPSRAPDLSFDNPLDQMGSFFGNAVSGAGDLNGDGYSDIVVGSWRGNSPAESEGNVFVFFGRHGVLRPVPDITIDNPLNQEGGFFGIAVWSGGDVNGDGYADLVVGASGQDAPTVDEGAVYVFLGGAEGPSRAPDFSLDNPTNQAGGAFGITVGGGDLDGDGYTDLVASAWFQTNREGRAYTYHGSDEGISTSPTRTLTATFQEDSFFGGAVGRCADLNGDGHADVVIGEEGYDDFGEDQGRVLVYFGGVTGVAARPSATLECPIPEESGFFGVSVATADARTMCLDG